MSRRTSADKTLTIVRMDRSDVAVSDLLELRQRIVDLYLRGMRNQSAIARELKVSRPTVARAIDLFKQHGLEGLSPKTRGRKMGAGRLLTPTQELDIRRRLHAGPPDPAVHGDAVWTRSSAMALVQAATGQTGMSERTLGDYLKRWGMTAGGARVRADEQVATVATVAVSRRHMLWELLAWAPFSTGLARQLARELCSTPWQGLYLFWGLHQRWTFQRTLQSLQHLYSAAAGPRRGASSPSLAVINQPPGFNIDAHWQSARRELWLRQRLSSHPHGQHWSLRVVPVTRVIVAHTRTSSRHTGPTPPTHTASPGLLLAAIRFEARPHFHAALIEAPTADEDEERLSARCGKFFAGLGWQSTTQIRLHVPAGASEHPDYARVLGCLANRAAEVIDDMPPPFITPGAVATVDIPMTTLRSRDGRQVMPATVSGYLVMDRNPPHS